MRLRRFAAVTVVAAFVLASCGGDDSGTAVDDSERIDVVANFYPVAEAATRVGGNRVRVTNLTPVGVEPHDIELTSRQVDELEKADLVLYLGQGFQPAVAKVAERRKTGRVDLLDSVHLQAGDDPHFWLDPQLMAVAVDTVVDALAAAAPHDVETFRANGLRYKDELRAVDQEFQAGLAACNRKEIVTAHEAFSYLATRYGLTQLPIAGLSPEAEPDADRLATLADEIRAKGITTVFYEEMVSPKVAETLAREAGVKTAVLNPIEGLSQDDVDAGKGYAAVMRDNLATLREVLDCR